MRPVNDSWEISVGTLRFIIYLDIENQSSRNWAKRDIRKKWIADKIEYDSKRWKLMKIHS